MVGLLINDRLVCEKLKIFPYSDYGEKGLFAVPFSGGGCTTCCLFPTVVASPLLCISMNKYRRPRVLQEKKPYTPWMLF